MMAQGKLTPQARMGIMRHKAKVERQTAAARAKGQSVDAQHPSCVTLVVTVSANDVAGTARQMKAVGAEVKSRLGHQIVVSIPVDSVDALQRIEGVKRIDRGHKGRMKSDVTRVETGASLLNGPTLPEGATAYTGKGVTLCLIDAGFDFQHPAFKDAEGRSRIKCVYRLGDEGGHKFTVNDPELGEYTFPGSVYDTPELIATLTTDDSNETHGTHTAGIAAGSLTPQGYGGIAPEADLVLIPMEEVTIEGFEDIDLDDYMELALAFIAAYAEQTSQPVVLSCSGNSHLGPHDGTSSVCEALNELSQTVIPVFSAGNEGGYPIHLYQKFSADKLSVKTLLVALTEDETGEYEYFYQPEVMGFTRTGDEVSIQLALKSINQFTGRLTTVWTTEKFTATPDCEEQISIFSSDDDATLAKYFEGTVAMLATHDENGRLCVGVSALGGVHNLYLWELTVGGSEGTEIDLWDNMVGFGGKNYLGLPNYVDGDSEMSGGDFTSTDRVISVGAYCANELYRNCDGTVTDTSMGSEDEEPYVKDDIAWFSSYGMTLNGVVQPTVCAPGVNVVSSVNHYFYSDMTYADNMQWQDYPYDAESGTSMSCPVVAGSIALWIQAKPDMTLEDVLDVMSHTSHTDSYTDADTKGRWGFGKIDTAAGIRYINNDTKVNPNISDLITTPSSVTYDLQGRRVTHRPAPGLYIRDGRKIVIK